MKQLKFITLIGVAALLATVSQAQTTSNFLQSAEGYLTSNNTNYTWLGNKLEGSVGADFENNQQWANNLEFQYNVNDSWGLGARMRNAGIAGVVESEQVKVSYALVNKYAIKVEASLYAGYDNQYDCAVIEPQIDIRKKLTENTFAGVYIGEPFLIQKSLGNSTKQWVPNIGVETGFTF